LHHLIIWAKFNVIIRSNPLAVMEHRLGITKHLKDILESNEHQEKVVCSILEHTTEHGAIAGKTQFSKDHSLHISYPDIPASSMRALSPSVSFTELSGDITAFIYLWRPFEHPKRISILSRCWA